MSSPTGFRVTFSEDLQRRIRELAERAEVVGRRQEYVKAFEYIISQLEKDPLGFGDQTHSLKALKLSMHTRIHSIIIVHYGVSADHRLVHLRTIDLFPSNIGL